MGALDLGGPIITPFHHDPGWNGTAVVQKSIVGNPTTIQPGGTITYQIYLACSDTEVDCPDFEFEDQFPSELEYVSGIPNSNAIRTVSYTGGKLRLEYIQQTDNPAGFGWNGGSNETLFLTFRLPTSNPPADGTLINNEAVILFDGDEHATDDASIEVDIPQTVTPVPSKAWDDDVLFATAGNSTTITLGGLNASPDAVNVSSMTITDTTASAWDHFDLATPVTLTAMPPGATSAAFQVCTLASCAAGDWVTADTRAGIGSFDMSSVTLANVRGVRVVFSGDLDGAPGATAGEVEFAMVVRATNRTSGNPFTQAAVSNCAQATATTTDSVAITPGSQSCDPIELRSSSITGSSSKAFTSTGPAVAGQATPVQIAVRATNTWPQPVHQMTFNEPAAARPDSTSSTPPP